MRDFVLSRDAAEEEEGPGHIGGLRAGGGEPGRLEAQRRQSHPRAPMGAWENGAAAWGGSSATSVVSFKKFLLMFRNFCLILPMLFLQVEKTRHLLLLREKLGDAAPVGPAPTTKSLSESLSPSMSSDTLSTSTSISSQISSTTFESAITPSESSGYDSADIESLVDREKELATKVREQIQCYGLLMVLIKCSLHCRFLSSSALNNLMFVFL